MSKLINYKVYYEKALTIRRFENLLLELFKLGKIFGTTHTCIGQETTPVVALSEIKKDDYVISNHRSHGHFLSYSENLNGMLNELLGKENGVCKGLAGSQHIHYKNFISNGILGNLVPVSAGLALSNKILNSKSITYIFIGDGAFGQGVLYETLNIVSLKNLRCMYIVENNKIAQTTEIKDNLSGQISDRFKSFNIKTFNTNSYSINHLHKTFKNSRKYISLKNKPCAVIVDTFRFSAHSKGDDTRSVNHLEKIKNKYDPLMSLKKKLSKLEEKKIREKVDKKIKNLLVQNKINL